MINIDEMIKASLKDGNKAELNAYRNLKSKILTAKTAKNAKAYDDTMEISIISKYVKELKEDSENYYNAGRNDLGDDYVAEASILEKLLPKAPSKDEIASCVWDFIETNNGPIPENKSLLKSQMGACIKYIKAKFPAADGKMISEIVKGFIA